MRLGRNIGLLGTEFGFSGTNFRVFGNKNTGFQEPMARVFRNSLNGLSGTRPYTKSPKSQGNLQTFTDITRARDLNSINNPLTPTPTRRLKRGLRPPGALYGPNRKRNRTPPLRGLRPLPAQTQPTRHTPTRKALRAPQTYPNHRAAALGGG
jgi:hypothetical protein